MPAILYEYAIALYLLGYIPLMSILPRVALLTAYYFIACLFTHKLVLLLVVISVVKWVV